MKVECVVICSLCSLRSHAAASYDHLELLRFLVEEAGADVNLEDSDGETPLFVCENVDTAEFLLDAGADPQITNSIGRNCMEVAFDDDREDVARFLAGLMLLLN